MELYARDTLFVGLELIKYIRRTPYMKKTIATLIGLNFTIFGVYAVYLTPSGRISGEFPLLQTLNREMFSPYLKPEMGSSLNR